MKEAYVNLLEGRRRHLLDELGPILPGDTEFVCEIGCGHGHFLTAYATAHPSRICLGVDLVSERVERARKKRDRAQLSNLHFIRSEARLFFDVLPAGARLSSIYILFPDPWPKMRHHKHRIMQPEFLEVLAVRATPECRLYFRTDYGPYFTEAQATVRDHPRWRLVEESWPFEYETVFQARAESYASLVAALRPAGLLPSRVGRGLVEG